MASPGFAVASPASRQQWNTGLTDCCADGPICCYGTCLSSVLYAENVQKIHGGGCCGPCCLHFWCPWFTCIFAGDNRTHMRNKLNLAEDPCTDCCVHCWCSSCATCQEARELKMRSALLPVAHATMMAPQTQAMAVSHPVAVTTYPPTAGAYPAPAGYHSPITGYPAASKLA